MKKVIVLTNAFMGGGTEVALNSLLNCMKPEEYDVTICCITKTGPLLKQVPKQIPIQEVQFSNPMHRVFVSGIKEKTNSLKMLLYKIKKKYYYKKYKQDGKRNELYEKILVKMKPIETEYDLLLDFHGYGYFLTVYGAEKIRAKKKAMWVHDENISWISKVVSYLPAYDKIFCVSKAVKDSFIRTCPHLAFKAEVFYNLTDTEKVKKKAQGVLRDTEYNGEFKILTIGRLQEQKGIDIAIESARILQQRGVQFRWYILGEGTLYKSLSVQVKQCGLEERFFLLGRRDNPFPYIRECQLYVQPSRHEGYATTVLEAKVLCKPILASDIPSNREQIIDGENGYLCKLEAEPFAERIQRLIEHPELCTKVVDGLKQERFDFSKEIEKLERLLT